jgi:hypothetical protein
MSKDQYRRHKIMRALKTVLPLLTLCLASSFAQADEKNCSDVSNRQARQECMKRQSNAEADCSAISDAQARQECAQRKQQNGADCSKLETAEAREQCARRKAK